MHFIRIYVPSLLACTTVFAQPVVPQPAGAGAAVPVSQDGAKRRSELKALLRSTAQKPSSGHVALDATQRQQLRLQLREQSDK